MPQDIKIWEIASGNELNEMKFIKQD